MAFFVEQCMKNMHIAGPQHHFRHTNRLTRLPFSSITCIKIPDTLFHLGPWELKGWWGMMGDSAPKVLAFSPIGENFRRRVGRPGCRDVPWRIIQQRAVRSERSWGAHVPIVGELLHDRLVAISGHGPSTSSTCYLILFIWFYLCWLVVWNIFLFLHMGRIIPTDELIFFQRDWNHQPVCDFYPWSGWETFSSRKQLARDLSPGPVGSMNGLMQPCRVWPTTSWERLECQMKFWKAQSISAHTSSIQTCIW